VSHSFRLHASILKADTGILESTRDWYTRAHYSSIHSTAGGVLVRTGSKLTLLSKDFSEIDKTTLPDFDRCIVSVSGTQRTILINCLNNELKISRFDVLEGNTLQLKYSWSESPPLYAGYSVTDSGIVASDESQRAVIFSKFESRKWDRIFKCTATCLHLFMAVADDFIFSICKDISLSRNSSLTLSSMDGQVLLTDQFDKGENLSSEPAISQNGRVVALLLNTVKIQRKILAESTELRTATHIAVFDLSLKKRILTINVSPLPKNDCDFALSPDGLKLAILNDRRVDVYDLSNR